MLILQRYRLVAEQGKRLTNGEKSGYVVDLAAGESPDSWQEIDDDKGTEEN